MRRCRLRRRIRANSRSTANAFFIADSVLPVCGAKKQIFRYVVRPHKSREGKNARDSGQDGSSRLFVRAKLEGVEAAEVDGVGELDFEDAVVIAEG